MHFIPIKHTIIQLKINFEITYLLSLIPRTKRSSLLERAPLDPFLCQQVNNSDLLFEALFHN